MAAPERSPPITPLPAPEDVGRLVLFGGTFDPPHKAHADLASRARDFAAGPEAWLVFVPAARSPFKHDAPTPEAHRLEMLRLASAEVARSCVWTDELDYGEDGEPSYWIDTLRRVRSLRPAASLWFIIGSDQAVAFHRWREAREILSIAQPIVLPRAPLTSPGDFGAALRETGAWTSDEIARARALLAPTPILDSSATAAREIIRSRGPDDPRLASLLQPAVLEYIRAHRLYAHT